MRRTIPSPSRLLRTSRIVGRLTPYAAARSGSDGSRSPGPYRARSVSRMRSRTSAKSGRLRTGTKWPSMEVVRCQTSCRESRGCRHRSAAGSAALPASRQAFEQLVVENAIGGQRLSTLERPVAVEVRHHAARFFDDDQWRSHVPWPEVLLHHGLRAPVGDQRVAPEVAEAALAPGLAEQLV